MEVAVRKPLLQVTDIQWQVPWLCDDIATTAQPVMQMPVWREGLNTVAQTMALCNHRDLPLRFVPQAELPDGMAYEAYISNTGKVPTRDNLHDFFNGLVWLIYPNTKRQLNALQAAEILKSGHATIPPLRGKLRDGATIFDENAAIFASADEKLVELLKMHRWQELFLTHQSAFQQRCKVFLFGHALMEKLTAPYKAITAHAWVVAVEPDFFDWSGESQRAWLDQSLCAQLVQGLTTANFTPLPVLGIPGWWPNQDHAYYADGQVFRPRRQ